MLLSLFMTQPLLAKSEKQYEAFVPIIRYIDVPGIDREASLSASLYVSENECWFSGTLGNGKSWLIKTNLQGDVLLHKTIHLEADTRETVKGLSKTENGLLIGVIDTFTTEGRVGLMKDDQLVRYTNLGEAKIFSYTSVEKGLLAQGVLYDLQEQTCRPQTTLIGSEGEILFQRNGTQYEMAGNTLSSSLSHMLDDLVFIVENRDAGYQSKQDLICVDLSGTEQWSISLDDDFSAQAFSACDGYLYLSGFSADWAEDRPISSKVAMTQCFSIDGTHQWTQKLSEPSQFWRASANQKQNISTSFEDGVWYIVLFNAEGEILNALELDAYQHYINRPTLVSNTQLIVLGTTTERLLICDIGF